MNVRGNWVKVKTLKEVTGWNSAELRRYKREGLIKWSRNSVDGVRYDYSSIPQFLLAKKTA